MDTEMKHDVRSVDRDQKRDRDSASKWSKGARAPSGCYIDPISMLVRGGNGDEQRQRVRPHQKKRSARPLGAHRIREEAISPADLTEAITDAHDASLEKKQRSLDVGMSPMATESRDMSTATPNTGCRGSVSLEAFVKVSAAGTEKLVRKEYEILDSHGEALTGRKARESLKGNPVPGTVAQTVTDDGFELV